MATCRECLHQELCDTYSRMGVTDVPADDVTICELFKPKSDYVKRERGEWKVDEFLKQNAKFLICSNCSAVIDCKTTCIDKNDFYFCPYCGSDMRKEDSNA